LQQAAAAPADIDAAQESRAVTAPMVINRRAMGTSMNDRLRPTARASMLVATESTSSTDRLATSMVRSQASPWNDSWIILPRWQPTRQGHPMVIGGDELSKSQAAEPTQHRHQRLKRPKAKAMRTRDATQGIHGHAAADRHGERIHGQAHGQEQSRKRIHGSLLDGHTIG
jgi:hypothetical protein